MSETAPDNPPRHDPPQPTTRQDYDGPPLRYRMTLAYDGANFHGWQKQHPPDQAPLRTVQQVVEDALIDLFKQPIILTGASRTDTGVHAEAQVAMFDVATPIPAERLHMAINGRLPDDIELRDIQIAHPDFHCIKDVVSKQYRYTILTGDRRPVWYRHLVHHTRFNLDPSRMEDAATRMLGTHDVEGFAAAGHGRTSTVRTIHHAAITHEPANDSFPGQRIHFDVAGNGFLLNMVRIMAGTLVEIGRGQFEPHRIDQILETADRQLAGPTLPPNGLCLKWIRYGEGEGGDRREKLGVRS